MCLAVVCRGQATLRERGPGECRRDNRIRLIVHSRNAIALWLKALPPDQVTRRGDMDVIRIAGVSSCIRGAGFIVPEGGGRV